MHFSFTIIYIMLIMLSQNVCYNILRKKRGDGRNTSGVKLRKAYKMNVLMLLKPKSEVEYLVDTYTLRQGLEKCVLTDIPLFR